MEKKKSIFHKICCFLFILVFSFSCFWACSAPGVTTGGGTSAGGPTTGGGGSTGGGTQGGGTTGGGSTGDGSSGESVGGVPASTIVKIDNDWSDFSSNYSGVYLLIDADENTKFYDDVTKSNKTFKDLLDRQFKVIADQVVYALSVVYGTNSETSHILDGYSVTIQDFQVLGTVDNREQACKTHTGNNLGLNCADCLAKIAGLRGTFLNNPFNFDNVMAGGYEYDEELKAFTQTLRTTSKWVSGTNISIDTVKEAIAKVFASGSLDSALTYDDALKQIDHLGITKSVLVGDKTTKSEEQLIVDYILNYIIGASNVQADNNIKNSFGDLNSIQLGDSGVELFSGNIDKHYYKAYEEVVKFIVQKALSIGLDGSYLNENGEFATDTKIMYPTLPRVTMKYYSMDYFKENSIGKSYYEGSETDQLEEGDGVDYEQNQNQNTVYYNIMKNNAKINSMILLPKMDEEDLETRKKLLKAKYGQDFVDNWTEISYVYANEICFGFNGIKGGENFYLTPHFFVKAQGETIVDSYVSNSYFNSSKGFHKSATECEVFYQDYYIYNQSNGLITNYNLKTIQEQNGTRKRMAEYDGMKLTNLLGQYNEDYFVSGKQKVRSDLFDIQPRYDSKDLDKFVPGINATFKGGNNFVQINFEYYNDAGQTIDTPEMNFFYFNGYA